MKDETISNLRDVLNQARKEANDLFDHADSLEQKLKFQSTNVLNASNTSSCATNDNNYDKNSGNNSDNRNEINALTKELKMKEDSLKSKLLALQMFTGIDFLPGDTKVVLFLKYFICDNIYD